MRGAPKEKPKIKYQRLSQERMKLKANIARMEMLYEGATNLPLKVLGHWNELHNTLKFVERELWELKQG